MAWSSSIVRWAVTAVVIACSLIAGINSASAGEQSLSREQRRIIEKHVRQYILNHPEIIAESIQKMQAREERESQERTRKNLVAMRDQLANDPTSPVGGNPNGDVTIVEFFDYRCAFCKRILPAITKVLKTDFKVRYVFKELPILGPDSVTAARAALAAWRINPAKYQKFHFALMESRGQLPETKVMAIAAKVGLGVDALKAAMRGPEIKKTIERNSKLAHVLGINGTPAFVIGNNLVPGAIDFATIQRLIANARGS